MTFKNYVYNRPDFEALNQEFKQIIDAFNNASSSDGQIAIINQVNKIRMTVDSMANIVYIRHSIDTQDAKYESEQEYFDEMMPVYEGLVTDFGKVLVASRFKEDLIAEFGAYWFEKVALQLRTFKQEIVAELVNENKLVTKYGKLMASAKIDFEGEIRNLSQMAPFSESKDRSIRKAAQLAVAEFLRENEETIDNIFDELVKIRSRIAKALGFNNFVDLGYARLGRTDYDSKMVATYRKQVEKDLVPLAQVLIQRQKERLGLDTLHYYDLAFKFNSGNPKPIGEEVYLIDQAHQMYAKMSPETKEFFEFMMTHELLDLVAKPGKQGGGYCTFIADYKSPFIFSNFNGTSGDVDVLTHEAGHAFQVYQSRDAKLLEYVWPTYEACEIHSMSMEFFAWPWMQSFFGEDEAKYKYIHLTDAILFIPYGVAVDEFQHYVYENPTDTPDQRKAMWRRIEKKYLPHKTYEGNDLMEKGCFWFRQSHIFSAPFYYIDYTLAQVCAFQYLTRSLENKQEAWDSYVKLCQLGGSKPFLELVEAAGLNNPFVEGTVAKMAQKIKTIFEVMNDKEM